MATYNNIDTFAELQSAINAANSNSEADVITITGDIKLTDLLPMIEESDMLTIDGGGFTISGDANGNDINDTGDVRLFFVRKGTVTFDSLTFSGGRAQGGSGGSGGAGMGGALFINEGEVTITDSLFMGNQAIGGFGGFSGGDGDGGGGGFSGGDGDGFGGGGDGGVGGVGNGGFGGGGGDGGFGGGGGGGGGDYFFFGFSGGDGGKGGFGGGGGGGGGGFGEGGSFGEGGFGGGNGSDGGSDYSGSDDGLSPGRGGGGGGGGGLGGAIFIRSGSLSVTQSSLTNNVATGGAGGEGASNGQGLGGAIFAISSTQNSNNNNQGMPESLPTITTTAVTFSGNEASDASDNTADNGGGNDQNNNDVFGSITEIVVDTTAPTVTAISRKSPTAQNTNADSAIFEVSFSEAVNDISINDFTLKTTGAIDGTIASVSATTSNTVEVTVNNITGEGTLSLDVPATATLLDDAGNALTTAFTTGEIYNIDNITTTPTINGDTTSNNSKPAFSGTAEANATVEVLDGTTSLGTTNANVNGEWSFTPTANLSEGSHTITAKATDSFGNASVESAALNIIIDSIAPTVALSSSSSAFVNGTFAVIATFSEATANFTGTDVVIENGTLSNFSGSGTTYTFDITPASDGTVTVDVANAIATDAAGNNNAGATQFSRTFDGTAPTVVLSSDAATSVNGTFAVTATFSEATADFMDTDIVVGNGTLSNFSGSGTTYTFDVIPTANGTVTVEVSAGMATDAAGNGNLVAAQLSREFDEALPTLLSIARQTPAKATTNADSLVFRTTFDEAVQNVDATDFEVSGTSGTLTINKVSDTTYDLTVSGGDLTNLKGSVGINLAASQDITDLAGNTLSSAAPAVNETYAVVQTGELVPTTSTTLEVKVIGDANTITLSLDQLRLNDISELLIFTTDAAGNNLTQIESISLLKGGELPSDYSPSFSLKSSDVTTGQLLQFQLVSNGVARTATVSSTTREQVKLTFDDGTILNASFDSRTATTNLLVGDANSIDLSEQTGPVNVGFSVFREASFNNTVGLYTTDSADGSITDPITSAVLKPGDAGYKEAAIARKLDVQLTGTNGKLTQFTSTFDAGSFLGLYLVADGTDAASGDVYFSHAGANSNGADHVKLLGNNTFGFEDMVGLGDADFNDVVVKFEVA